MDNSIYVALSKQVGIERQMDLLANNLANSTTTGFKSSDMIFSQYLMKDAGGKTAYATDAGVGRNTQQGTLETTGNPLDAAIQGDGYFQIQTPQGMRYTRAGNFTINEQGQLATNTGDLVMDDAGQPIEFQIDDDKITIFENGKVEVDGEDRGNIGVYKFQKENELKNVGNNLYSSDENPVISEDAKLSQGMLENSNVSPILEITKLITAQRNFVGNSDFINAIYDLQNTAVQTIGRDS